MIVISETIENQTLEKDHNLNGDRNRDLLENLNGNIKDNRLHL